MAETTRDVTVTFEDGTSHKYAQVPRSVTPDEVEQRALKDFGGKKLKSIDGGSEAAAVAPKSGKAAANASAVDEAIALFGRDPSKEGKLSAGDYFNKAAAGLVSGGTLGAGIGLLTAGPVGALGGTITGSIGGAISGLLEAKAEDMGYGAGTQFAAGMLAPGAGAASKIGLLIERQAAKSTASALGSIAAKTTGIPVVGKATTSLAKAGEARRPVDVSKVEELTGFKGTTAEANIVGKEADDVKQSITNKFESTTGTKIPANTDPETHIYNTASSAINKATLPVQGQKQSFVNSSFFNRAATIEGRVNPAQANTYKQLFEDAAGNPLPGNTVIRNLKSFKYGEDLSKTANLADRDLRWAEGSKLEKEFNGWLVQRQQQLGLPARPWQADARAVYEQVYVASAKDNLPKLIEEVGSAAGSKTELKAAAGELENQLWNLSKTPEGQAMFWKQFNNTLKTMPAKDAKVVWNEIKGEVGKRLIKDKQKLDSLNEVMSKAASPKDISRAARIINGIMTNLTITGLSNNENTSN